MSDGRTIVLGEDPLFAEHRPTGYHPERPERLAAVGRAIAKAREKGVDFASIAPRDATPDELAAAHEPRMVEGILKLAGRDGAIDPDTLLSPRSVDAARRAAGVGIEVVRAVLASGAGARGFAALRPPGHHATPRAAMGFCLFNNVAVAARWALANGARRVAVVDFDVHHGNGTQDVFYADPRVLFVSLHQAPLYPGTGGVDEVGEGDARGTTLNVPLSLGAGDAEYAHAFDKVVVPAVEAFGADLLLVSAGFDAHVRDPLASMEITDRGYEHLAARLGGIGGGTAPVAFFLEGGYDLAALEGALTTSLVALAAKAGVAPTFGPPKDRQRDEIEHALEVHEAAARP